MVSSFPGVMHGPLSYGRLELDKVMALRASKGGFNALMTLSETSKSDLQWWIAHTHTTFKLVSHGSPSVTIYSDASLSDWGGCGGCTLPTLTNLHLRHPLHNKLKLMACMLSGIHREQVEFRRKLQPLFSCPGEDPLENNFRSSFRSGTVLAVKGVSIPSQFIPCRLSIS